MTLTAKQSTLVSLGLILFALLACKFGKSDKATNPIPDDKKDYIGKWRGSFPGGTFLLSIDPDGKVNYERKEGSKSKSISGGTLTKFDGNDFEVKVLLVSTTFKVSSPPHKDGQLWKMTVDDVELSRRDTTGDQSSTDDLGLDVAEMRKDDGKGGMSEEVTDTFSPSDKIHCYISWDKPKAGTTIKFIFTAVKAGTIQNQKITEVKVVTEADSNNANGSLTPRRPFPKGSYKVEIYINDKLARTVEYQVA